MTDTPFELQRKTLQRLKALQDGVELTSIAHPPLQDGVEPDGTTPPDPAPAGGPKPSKKKAKKKTSG